MALSLAQLQQLQQWLSQYRALFGLPASVLGLLAPGQSPASRATAGISTLGQLNKLSGALGGPALSGGWGSALGGLGAAVGLGSGIYNIASDPNLSAKQKAGEAIGAAGNTALSLTVPYGWLYAPTKAVGGAMLKSGSPQIRAGGRQVLAPLEPVMGLERVLTGKQSPKAAFNTMIENIGQVPVFGRAASNFFEALGLGTDPTHGTKMRQQVHQIAKQIESMRDFKPIQNALTSDEYNSYSPEQQKAAYSLAAFLGQHAPSYAHAPNDYQIQVGNSLLKRYGADITELSKRVLAGDYKAPPVESPAPSTMPPPPSTGPFGISPDTLKRLQEAAQAKMQGGIAPPVQHPDAYANIVGGVMPGTMTRTVQ